MVEWLSREMEKCKKKKKKNSYLFLCLSLFYLFTKNNSLYLKVFLISVCVRALMESENKLFALI